MEVIKVKIRTKAFGYGIGISSEGNPIFIKNGDLKQDQSEVEVIFINKKGEKIITEIPETYNSNLLIEQLVDSEGLFSINSIEKFITRRHFQIQDKWIFLHKYIEQVFDYILEFDELINISKVSITEKRVQRLSVIRFGLSFKSALDKLNRMGIQKARLYCENKQDFSKDGVVAEMLVNLTEDNDGLISIETWQGVEGEEFVYYTHGIMNLEKTSFQHFDGAIIGFNPEDIDKLFRENKKLKGNSYKKVFRLDGHIEINHVYQISNRFFPLDNLIDEYFEIEEIKEQTT